MNDDKLKCCINNKVNNFEGPEYIDAGDCHLSLAIAHIEALLKVAAWSNDTAAKPAMYAAQAFLDEVKGNHEG